MRWGAITALLAVTVGVTACAYYDDYALRGHGWSGRSYGQYVYEGRCFADADADLLDPWLASTAQGRQIVGLGFDGRNGRISDRSARRANVWFRRYADRDGNMRLTDREIRAALVHAARQADRLHGSG